MIQYSIIVPVYNVEDYLRDCLDSILAQTSPSSWEAILVDDGSRDGSGAICDAYVAQDARFRVIHKENGGVSAARNLGLRAAKGKYVLYLDSDDFWAPNLLAELDGMLISHPDIVTFAYDRISETYENTFHPISVIPKGESGVDWLNRLFSCYALPGSAPWCYAFRREFLLENQLFFREDLQVSEDFECNIRALSMAKQIVGSNKSLYGYRMRGSSVTSASLSTKKLMDNLTCKADAFRKYPVAALANLYAGNALLVGQITKEDATQPLDFMRKNRDILRCVNHPKLKLGCLLMIAFGDYTGACIYAFLQKLSRKLRISA